MHPVPIEKDHANQAPFLNNLWKENPAWQSSKWKPMFRHDRGGCTFTNKRTLDLYHSINFQPPQGEWRRLTKDPNEPLPIARVPYPQV